VRIPWLLALIALLGLAAVGHRLSPAAQGAAGLVATGPAHILTTADGRTLYIYTKDKPNSKTSVCTGQCATFWPPLAVPAGMTVSATMPGVPGKFGVALRASGTKQLTYNGWPLYTFAKDKDSGDVYGEGVINSWWAVVANRSK
jgi:predicted lipoprotein with Yx(FWY)xxD motif